ncbi:MAG: hypothetical protein H0Z19_10680 [Archaeoglobus sp.]|uniref:hypothetical protein n=1 Tax=Archaeoglobus sp. TaxID=1872626 RepID=UPI001D488C01|nr:hypothetical protein [Archaeoglobus sp.]MBO8180917.1 hypothetical protein [Archaeoglobus sp.]
MLVPIDEELKEWIEIAIEYKVVMKEFKRGFFEIYELDRIPVYPQILEESVTIEEICNLIRPSVLWMNKRGFSEKDIGEKVGEVYGINPEHAKVLVERILGELESKDVEEAVAQ